MPSNDINKDLDKALTGVKLGLCENEKMTEALQYCMLLVGIRVNNYPAQSEFDLFKIFLRRNFPGNTVEELLLAFEMAIAGKLDMGKDGAKAYENFSCEYIARILNAYRSWSEKVIRYEEKHTLPAPKQYTKEEILDNHLGYCNYKLSVIKKNLKPPLRYDGRRK